jgi:predicted kinase
MDNALYIIRGLPGSGKSTYAKKLLKETPTLSHYEADMYFYVNGVYTFNLNKLHIAHQWCLNSTENDLKLGKTVIVSNTFTQLKELAPYIKLSNKYNTNLVVLKTVGNYKSIHNVPEETLIKMKNRWEDYKGEEIAV